MSGRGIVALFDQLSKNHNKEYEDIITEVMFVACWLIFEQNIFLSAIRNFKNTDKVRLGILQY
ncbi:MAG: hypothetical protein ACLTUL_03110 [Blautia faecis]